jgi:hypothetical protein
MLFATVCIAIIFLLLFKHTVIRVSYETGLTLKEPKLEPKLVLTLSETKRLVSAFQDKHNS